MFNLYGTEYEEDTYVIDSNDRVIERLNQYKEEIVLKKERINKARVQEFYDALTFDEEGNPVLPMDDEGYILIPMDDEGNPLVNIDEEGNLLDPIPGETDDSVPMDLEEENPEEEMPPEEISALAQQIIDDANNQAAEIIAQAEERSEAMLEHAKEEGRKEGYNEGVAQGVEEYHKKEQELEEERQALQANYQAMRESMEGDLVDIICDVVEKAFKVRFKDSKEIILHLVDNTLLNVDSSKVYMIRVGEKYYGYLNQNKEALKARLGSDVVLDIIMDPLMDEGSCMIETDGGVFNCGIDVQLQSLIRDLKILNS